MNDGIERDLGEQPIVAILAKHGLKSHDVVAASTQQITHKMVSRACKGRRLTVNVQCKIRNAVNNAVNATAETEDQIKYKNRDLFNY